MSRATPDDYYDHLPEAGHGPGDIWCGLPSFGVLKVERVAGIVITPACDLQNAKTETITYLPVIPVQAWFATPALQGEIRGELLSAINALAQQKQQLPAELGRRPTTAELDRLAAAVEAITPSDRTQVQLSKIRAGISALRCVSNQEGQELASNTLSDLFGAREFADKCRKLVRNSWKPDLHFLPARGRWAHSHPDFAGPAVALFRYPLTAPVELFDLANEASADNWPKVVDNPTLPPAAKLFSGQQPLRVARLQSRFFVDLLSRYTNLYSRVGAPDFPERVVATLAGEVVALTVPQPGAATPPESQ